MSCCPLVVAVPGVGLGGGRRAGDVALVGRSCNLGGVAEWWLIAFAPRLGGGECRAKKNRRLVGADRHGGGIKPLNCCSLSAQFHYCGFWRFGKINLSLLRLRVELSS